MITRLYYLLFGVWTAIKASKEEELNRRMEGL